MAGIMDVYVYNMAMGRVISDGTFTIYVYAERGGKHHKPHCHVLWAGEEAVLEIPNLDQLVGDPLPRAGYDLAQKYVDAIVGKWEELNGN